MDRGTKRTLRYKGKQVMNMDETDGEYRTMSFEDHSEVPQYITFPCVIKSFIAYTLSSIGVPGSGR